MICQSSWIVYTRPDGGHDTDGRVPAGRSMTGQKKVFETVFVHFRLDPGFMQANQADWSRISLQLFNQPSKAKKEFNHGTELLYLSAYQ